MKGFSFYGAASAAVAALAAAVVLVVPADHDAKAAAWLGVGLATASGAIALLLKRRAMATDGLQALTAGVKALGLVMAVRGILLACGLFWVARHGEGALGFVVGFFPVYLGQQWLEISYLLAEQKQHSRISRVQTP